MDTGEHRRGELAYPTFHNGMLLRFFGHFRLFFVIFCDFRRSSSVCMHLGALWTQENTGGVSWHIQPFIMACYFDFSAIFRLFFVIFRDFRHSSSVCMHLGALWTQENTGGVSWHIQPFIMACYFDFSAIFRLFFVLFCDFRHSSSVCMHLGTLRTQENTGGVSWHIQPFIMACYFDFSAIFRLFFVISCVFHALEKL